jgi:hypothetical protein
VESEAELAKTERPSARDAARPPDHRQPQPHFDALGWTRASARLGQDGWMATREPPTPEDHIEVYVVRDGDTRGSAMKRGCLELISDPAPSVGDITHLSAKCATLDRWRIAAPFRVLDREHVFYRDEDDTTVNSQSHFLKTWIFVRELTRTEYEDLPSG